MKILLCEDEKPIQTIVCVTLLPRAHTVDVANDVDEAIELFEAARKRGETYDLIMSDVGVPGPSGYALAGYVRGRGYEGRLAMFTNKEPEIENLAMVKAEYWPKVDAMGNLVARVEWVAE